MTKKKILITGCSGFVGYNLVKKLSKSKRYQIIGTYFKNKPKFKKKIKLIKADLTQKKNCFKVTKNIDYIFVCSAVTSGAKVILNKPLDHLNPNLIMNTYLLESSYSNKVKKFIFISSNTVYPVSQNPMKENDAKYNFFDKYFIVGWMKMFTEVMCKMYSQKIKKPMQTIIVRPGNLYGVHDKFDWEKSKVIPATIRKILENNKEIKVWGNGKDLKDFLYIEDFISGIIKVLNIKERFYVVNIANGKSFTIRQIIKNILHITNKKLKIKYDLNIPSMIPVRKIDIKKAKKDLKWSPKINLYQGLNKTINWYISKNDNN